MNHHTAAPGHGGADGIKDYELGYWLDGDFHYHVIKWNQ